MYVIFFVLRFCEFVYAEKESLNEAFLPPPHTVISDTAGTFQGQGQVPDGESEVCYDAATVLLDQDIPALNVPVRYRWFTLNTY